MPFDILRENLLSEDLGITYRLSFSPSVSVSILASEIGVDAVEPLIAFGGTRYNNDKVNTDRGQRGAYLLASRDKRKIVLDDDFEEFDKGNTVLFWCNLPGTETE